MQNENNFVLLCVYLLITKIKIWGFYMNTEFCIGKYGYWYGTMIFLLMVISIMINKICVWFWTVLDFIGCLPMLVALECNLVQSKLNRVHSYINLYGINCVALCEMPEHTYSLSVICRIRRWNIDSFQHYYLHIITTLSSYKKTKSSSLYYLFGIKILQLVYRQYSQYINFQHSFDWY